MTSILIQFWYGMKRSHATSTVVSYQVAHITPGSADVRVSLIEMYNIQHEAPL